AGLARCKGDAAAQCRYLADLLTAAAKGGGVLPTAPVPAGLSPAVPVPPGAPIGSSEECWFCGLVPADRID
ncbi:hypothetical protein MTR62_19440, partial [Novosphingobium sp. 1949]